MIKNDIYLTDSIIRLFVYGTLKRGQRLDFFMKGAKYVGKFYTQGQLMKTENDNVYIDFDYSNVVTIGEIYLVDFYCLQRINHLEVFSGEFPKGYELNVLPVWEMPENRNFHFYEDSHSWAFFYKFKKSPTKILTGDYNDDFIPIEELERVLANLEKETSVDEILEIMRKKLSIFEGYQF